MDCLGISSFSQVNFDGSGLMSPIAQDLVDILLPVATLLCGFSDLYRTSSIPLFSCNGVSSGVIGQCQEVKTTLVRIRSENFPDRTWGLDQNGDAFINQGFSGNIFYVVPGLTGQPGTVSFNSVEYPCSYLRHFNFALRLESSQNPANPEIYNEDATFYPRPNQFIPGFTAYESVNFPGQFIRHLGFRLLLNTNDGSPLFARDASFSIENIDLLQSCNN
ncbi:uncharacterized protein LOC106156933 [Lingula anatina]|nr:uncharacterized protein LOC106156933 [Lingula anatina]|eukprot:XP_013387833.1 uncharacterized protein LOC106156933 [Lingula anatina]